MASVRTHFILQYYCVDTSVSEHILVVISYSVQRQGRIQGGLWGLETPLQKYIRVAKRMMYWYKNTLKCIISRIK